MIGLYIHVPFCRSRCIYCDFYSTLFDDNKMNDYTQSLVNEIKERSDLEVTVQSVYFGGGTPSMLPYDNIEQIFSFIYSNFKVCDKAEITFEVNPDDVTMNLIKVLKSCGVNRVSLGVQSFNDDVLRFVARRHSAEDAKSAVELLYNNGIENISIDLIYGFPKQSYKQWRLDVNEAFNLPISHISCYALSFESNTKLYEMLKNGFIQDVDDEISRKMYDYILKVSNDFGFIRYEISNFALPNKYSLHNYSYWDGTKYLGFGPAAHSFDGKNKRRHNEANLEKYIKKTPVPYKIEILTKDELLNEKIFTSLRTMKGLNLNKLSCDEKEYILSSSKEYISNGSLILQDSFLKLADKSVFISNSIISDLMKV